MGDFVSIIEIFFIPVGDTGGELGAGSRYCVVGILIFKESMEGADIGEETGTCKLG